MVAQDLNSSEVGNMSNTVKDYSVDPQTIDSPTGNGKTFYINQDWEKQTGNYKSIPELKSTIDTKSKWIIGKGVQAEGEDKKIIDGFRGWGKDTANTLIQNFARVYYVGGDSFAEIIRDDSIFRKITTWFGITNPGKPVNLKPLNPGRMKIIVNEQGMLEGYEQISMIEGGKSKPFKSEDIFHLAKNRFADEIHGTGIITAIENIILMRNEAMSDLKTVFHRYVKPLWIWRLNTDNIKKIAAFKAKADASVANSENIYIPMGAAEADRVSVPQFSTLDPLPWIRDLTDYFYQATNTPDVVVGSAKQTVEASAKILFLGFEESVRDDQIFIMENFKAQLGIDIKLEFPTPIEADLIGDAEKDGAPGIQKKETKIDMEGKK
jgi:hypothetical protein